MKVYILLSLIIGTTCVYADWISDLQARIDQVTGNIQNNVHQMQQQIQANVRNHLAQIDHLHRDIAERVDKINDQVANSTPMIIINGNSGSSRSVISGTLPNGEPYFHDVGERIIGDTLHRFESVYNPKTKEIEKYHTTLDLKDPNAKPVHVPEEVNKASAPEEAKGPSEEVEAPEPKDEQPKVE